VRGGEMAENEAAKADALMDAAVDSLQVRFEGHAKVYYPRGFFQKLGPPRAAEGPEKAVTIEESNGRTWELRIGKDQAYTIPLRPSVLRALRRRAGLTQGQLADKLGLHVNTIGRWETGKTHVDVATTDSDLLIRLFKHLVPEKVRPPGEGLFSDEVMSSIDYADGVDGYDLILEVRVKASFWDRI